MAAAVGRVVGCRLSRGGLNSCMDGLEWLSLVGDDFERLLGHVFRFLFAEDEVGQLLQVPIASCLADGGIQEQFGDDQGEHTKL